jgi:hypothetical protein
MAINVKPISLTRPAAPVANPEKHLWQYYAGPATAVVALMALMVLFVVSAAVAVSVSELTDPARAAVQASRLGRVQAYEAWLLPVAVAAIALAKLGIAITLWGITRRLWIRVETIKQTLPALVGRAGSL